MSSGTLGCLITPNPDIAGIGVRVSIYIQALLSLVHPAISAWNGELDLKDIESLRALYQGTLITACALLFSAFIQAKSTFGLSVYHALIVLNLSWLNNANAIIYTLYILLWWIVEFFKLEEATESSTGDDDSYTTSEQDGAISESQREILTFRLHPTLYPELANIRRRAKRGLIVVGGLTSVHLIIAGVLGLWVWFNITSSTFRGSECLSEATFPVFNFDVPITSTTLRRVSLAVYFMMIVPIINVYIFLSIIGLAIGIILLIPIFAILCSFTLWLDKLPDDPIAYARVMHRCSAVLVLIASLASQLYFIVNTEQFISRNTSLVDSSEGTETDWTFGQTLAIGIIALPIVEVYKAIRDQIKRDMQNRNPQDRTLSREGTGGDFEMQRLLHSDVKELPTSRKRVARRNSV
ncbi:hypothetical protein E1B28_010427 [Marasmius oreades]|uniref:Uncharacterized protein n=1 Tax=Marasmius oreades TaxID=181124 RepID=A0A9P7RX18_9AGAR|nr:uncharacterized protein E1B28_010427 [Marasmius oreades]KAG7091389.1 hypothetical protein E1B28_010427 [Marasmius oreades]